MLYRYDGVLANRRAGAQEGDLPSPRSENEQTTSKHQQQPSTARNLHGFKAGAELLQLPVLSKWVLLLLHGWQDACEQGGMLGGCRERCSDAVTLFQSGYEGGFWLGENQDHSGLG